MADALPTPIAILIDAANAGDTDDFLDSITVDGFVEDGDRVFTGHDEIRRWSDAEFIGADATLEVLSVETTDDVTTVQVEVGGSGFTGASTFEFVVDGDLVSSMTISS